MRHLHLVFDPVLVPGVADSGNRVTQIVSLAGIGNVVKSFVRVYLLACCGVDCVRPDGCAIFMSEELILAHGESIFGHVSVRLELLLDHIHILHCVGMHAILDLRNMPPSKRVLRLLR